MTSRELIAWSSRHERRRGTWWTSPFAFALAAGIGLAGWVAWRSTADPSAGTRAWLVGSLLAFAVAFLRVPFHLYWRTDAALLAQLPIGGRALFDAAWWRCARASAATTLAVVLGSLPLVRDSGELVWRHVLVAGTLGLAAAAFLPAVATYAASLVAASQSTAVVAVRSVAGTQGDKAQPPSTALLGALPGFASTIVIVGVVVIHPWLAGDVAAVSPAIVLGLIAGVSLLSIVGARALAPTVMDKILRDVSALDRQHLATLEIRPPTALERGIARVIGDAALPYSKDARLMRRRYPMAFALGSLGFLILAIVGLARPDDPATWIAATIVGLGGYAVALAGRLDRPPIELTRHSRTMPLGDAAVRTAKLVWLASWWVVFVIVPATFAAVRVTDTGTWLTVCTVVTVAVLATGRGLLSRRG